MQQASFVIHMWCVHRNARKVPISLDVSQYPKKQLLQSASFRWHCLTGMKFRHCNPTREVAGGDSKSANLLSRKNFQIQKRRGAQISFQGWSFDFQKGLKRKITSTGTLHRVPRRARRASLCFSPGLSSASICRSTDWPIARSRAVWVPAKKLKRSFAHLSSQHRSRSSHSLSRTSMLVSLLSSVCLRSARDFPFSSF